MTPRTHDVGRDLPVRAALPAVLDALAEGGAVVLEAPPGAGKTTLVPLALRHLPWCEGKVVMLEPRRLATRAAAARMAALLGERVGDTVGHRMRADTRVGPSTRVEVVTEGVLTRWLQRDPGLTGVSAVVFDEFHERSLDGDLGLALCLDVRATLRPDLRVVVMSATIDGDAVANVLGDATVVRAHGRTHPVSMHWASTGWEGGGLSTARERDVFEAAVVRTVGQALAEQPGDALVFLPGMAELRRVAARLSGVVGVTADVLLLHGSLPPNEQDRALAPSPTGRRKVVLTTSIAETSLTVEGVRIVVDAGLARVPRFDPRRGMGELATVRVSRASAEQRAGRAGRTEPGACYRLWSQAEHARLLPSAPPEITAADLTSLALELACWGTAPSALRWLDPPSPGALDAARRVLAQLDALDDALDDTGRPTAHGRAIAALGLHPRLAHLVVRGTASGHASLACVLGALLADSAPSPVVDLRERVEALDPRRHDVDRRIVEEARRLARRIHAPVPVVPITDAGSVGALVAIAYPDRIGVRRGPGRFVLTNGTGTTVPVTDPLAGCEVLIVADIEGAEGRVRLAAPSTLAEVRTTLGPKAKIVHAVRWDSDEHDVVAVREERLGAIALTSTAWTDAPAEACRQALLDGVRTEGLALLSWPAAATSLRQRVGFLRDHVGDPWPDLSDTALLATLDDWLGPCLGRARRRTDLARVDISSALTALLPWPLQSRLDQLAPTHVQVPSGSRVPLDYAQDPPVLAVRLQEVFGLTHSPTVVDGTVAVMMHLLSPAGRPVQVTQDLASFWSRGYREVRAELRGRYPRHHWPDDPTTAEPTRKVKPRRSG